jgi:vitamin B12 transporter
LKERVSALAFVIKEPKPMKKIIFSSTALLAFVPFTVYAETPKTEDPQSEIVVTALRASTPLIKTGQSIDILDAKLISEKQTPSLAALLTLTPSLAISQNGGLGTSASARIRGAESDQTLYILDGIRLSDPSQVGGGNNLGLMTCTDLSRIEVVRGPLSTLWGSRAIGGVVNLISRKPTKPLEANLTLQGLDDYHSFNLGLGGKLDKLSYRLSASNVRDNGVSAFKGGSETDEFKQNSLRLSTDYTLNEAHKLTLQASKTRSLNAYDGFAPPTFAFGDTGDYGRTDEQHLALGYRFSGPEDAITAALSLSRTMVDRNDFSGSGFQTVDARGVVDMVDFIGTAKLTQRLKSVFGLSHERSDIKFSSFGGPILKRQADLASGFVQLSFDPYEALNLTGSLRYDDHSTFGGQTLGHISTSYSVSDSLRLRASIGQGFKVPSLFQLYSEFGNEALKPETALSTEVGFDIYMPSQKSVFGVTLFERETKNQIDFQSCFRSTDPRCVSRPRGFYNNIIRTRALGYELDYKLNLGDKTKVRANYSRLSAKNDITKADLPRRPKVLANIDVTHDVTEALTLGIGVRYSGSTTDSSFSSARLKAYGLVDLRASYKVSQSLSLFGRLENATDIDYETAKGYGTAGQRLWLGIRASL